MFTSLVASAAIAQPAAPKPAQPPASTVSAPVGTPLFLDVTIATGSLTRTHQLVLLANPTPGAESCGSIADVVANRHDEVDVCARGTGQAIKLIVTGHTMTGKDRYRARWETAVIRGARTEVGSPSGARFTIAMR